MAWTKKNRTPEELALERHKEMERRAMNSAYRCGPRTGGKRKLKPAPVTLTVHSGTEEEALLGNQCGEV